MPAHRRLGYETRPAHPLHGKITQRRTIERMERTSKLELVVDYVDGHKHLPIVQVRRAA